MVQRYFYSMIGESFLLLSSQYPAVSFAVVEVLEKQNPRRLFHTVQLAATPGVFVQDVVDILEGLFKQCVTPGGSGQNAMDLALERAGTYICPERVQKYEKLASTWTRAVWAAALGRKRHASPYACGTLRRFQWSANLTSFRYEAKLEIAVTAG